MRPEQHAGAGGRYVNEDKTIPGTTFKALSQGGGGRFGQVHPPAPWCLLASEKPCIEPHPVVGACIPDSHGLEAERVVAPRLGAFPLLHGLPTAVRKLRGRTTVSSEIITNRASSCFDLLGVVDTRN